jgi:tetratricopeptide (TPR) repeat protein
MIMKYLVLSFIAALAVFTPHAATAQDWSQLKPPADISDSEYEARMDEVEDLIAKGLQANEEGHYEDCITWAEKAVDASETWLGEGPFTILALKQLGFCQAQAERYTDAEATYLRVKRLAELFYGPDDDELIYIEGFLGTLYSQTGLLNEAETHYKRALDLCERLCATNSDRVDRLRDLAELYTRMGREAEAKPLLDRAAALEGGT